MWDFVHKPTILQHTFVPKAVEQMVWITDVMSLVVFPVKGHWFLRHTAGETMFHTLIWLQFLTLHNQSLHLAICKCFDMVWQLCTFSQQNLLILQF